MRILLLFLLAGLRLNAQTCSAQHYGLPYPAGRAVVALPDNGLLVLTASSTAAPQKITLHRVAPDGTIAWTKLFDGYSVWATTALDLALTTDGHVVLLAESEHPLGPYRKTILIKTTFDGDQVWRKEFGLVDLIYPKALEATPTGELLVAGSALPVGMLPQFYLGKIRQGDGSVVWEKTYNYPTQFEEWYAVAVAPDGSYAAAGYDATGAMALSRLDSAGTLLWTKSFPAPGANTPALAVAALADGVVGAGVQNSAAPGSGAWIVRTDNAGNLLWTSTGGPDVNYPYAALPAGNSVLLAGWKRHTDPPYNQVPVWFKLDAQGQLEWQQTFVIDSVPQNQASSAIHDFTGTADGFFAFVGGWRDLNDTLPSELLIVRGLADSTAHVVSSAPSRALIFPNPASGTFCWTLPDETGPVDVEIMDMNGRRWQAPGRQASDCWLPNGVPSGVYLVWFRRKGGVVAVGKVRIL